MLPSTKLRTANLPVFPSMVWRGRGSNPGLPHPVRTLQPCYGARPYVELDSRYMISHSALAHVVWDLNDPDFDLSLSLNFKVCAVGFLLVSNSKHVYLSRFSCSRHLENLLSFGENFGQPTQIRITSSWVRGKAPANNPHQTVLDGLHNYSWLCLGIYTTQKS